MLLRCLQLLQTASLCCNKLLKFSCSTNSYKKKHCNLTFKLRCYNMFLSNWFMLYLFAEYTCKTGARQLSSILSLSFQFSLKFNN